MKFRHVIIFLGVLTLSDACKPKGSTSDVETQKWQLGWRLVNAAWDQQYTLAEQQFDSLRAMGDPIDVRFLATGLTVLYHLNKKDEIRRLLGELDDVTLNYVCQRNLFTQTLTDIPTCQGHQEKVENKELQLELLNMYVADQSARGNVVHELIEKYQLTNDTARSENFASVDKRNRDRLKVLIEEFGFPTKKLVGEDGMQSVFIIIQHADNDKAWQKQQLLHIERAVKRGDLDGDNYAYLFDRIRVNDGEKQRYGTQFKNVNASQNLAELSETEDPENLDKRRMEIGLMPIDMYKKLTLKFLLSTSSPS